MRCKIVSIDICFFIKEWWIFGEKNTCLKDWNLAETPPPWKPKVSVMLDIPGATCPSRIRIDIAHTWAIGVGKEFCASSIIVLARLGFFGGGSIPVRLERGYQHFREWCYFAKQHTQLRDFSLQTFKVTSLLVWFVCSCDDCFASLYVWYVGPSPAVDQLRLQQYPVLAGKGHDCIVVHKWLSYVLAQCKANHLEPQRHSHTHISTFCLSWLSQLDL